MPLQATSGAASYDAFGGGVPVVPTYIEDVFSTYLYTGTNVAQTITNGIDLSGKGGLVWFKNRSALTGTYAGFDRHILFDNIRTGATNGGADGGGVLRTNAATLDDATVTYLSSYNNNGVTIASNATISNAEFINQSGTTFASWTWRKQPKYFDIQTWTGTGSNRTISHSLGSVPGCIIVKRTDTTGAWQVYHRSLANTEYLVLNTTDAKATGATRWNSTTPTSTEFSLGTDATVNASGGTYVAYLFAHDAGGFGLTGTDNVISCGSYTGNGSTDGPVINLGYEPQWLLIKSSSASNTAWTLIDNMRGMTVGGADAYLKPNSSDAETTSLDLLSPTATGFKLTSTLGLVNGANDYIYIAIRRGPMKVPTSGTGVYSVFADGASTNPKTFSAGFPTDFAISQVRSTGAGSYNYAGSRLTGNSQYLVPQTTGSEQADATPIWTFDLQNSFKQNISAASMVSWLFRRAPSFFDEVCYTVSGFAANNVAHNLTVTPELFITKPRGSTGSWTVYGSILGATNKYMTLNDTQALQTSGSTVWGATSSTFSEPSTAKNGTYVCYLFATCAGVSKVFSYTGNGSSQTINCGFTAGSRWVMIKRTDSTGDWYVWDSARGIVAGNDPHLSLNTTAAEVTTDDSVDTDNTGFIVNQVAATNVNVSSATYIGIAIA